VGVTAVFGLLFPALGDFAQEREHFVGCDGAKIPVFAEVITELGDRNTVGLDRIFSRIHLVLLPIDLSGLFQFHGLPPVLVVGTHQTAGGYKTSVDGGCSARSALAINSLLRLRKRI